MLSARCLVVRDSRQEVVALKTSSRECSIKAGHKADIQQWETHLASKIFSKNMFGQGAPQPNGAGGFGGFGGFGKRGPERGGDIKAKAQLTFRQAVDGATITLNINGKPITARIPKGVTDGQKYV